MQLEITTKTELQTLFGDLAIARDWSFYRNNPGAVEAIGEGLSGIERDVYANVFTAIHNGDAIS